jgi:hypothetical protein
VAGWRVARCRNHCPCLPLGEIRRLRWLGEVWLGAETTVPACHWERDSESVVAGRYVARCRNHCLCLPLGARSGECGGWAMCGLVQKPLSLPATGSEIRRMWWLDDVWFSEETTVTACHLSRRFLCRTRTVTLCLGGTDSRYIKPSRNSWNFLTAPLL